MHQVRSSVVGVALLSMVGCASVKSCCKPERGTPRDGGAVASTRDGGSTTGSPESIPVCGACDIKLDLNVDPKVRQVKLENITDFSGCFDGPPWDLMLIRLEGDGNVWTYTPDGTATISDLAGPHEFKMVPTGAEPPDGANIEKARFTLKSQATNKTHDRGCIGVSLNGASSPPETECDNACP